MWHRILTIWTLGAELFMNCQAYVHRIIPCMSGRYCRVTFPNVFAMVGRPVASGDHIRLSEQLFARWHLGNLISWRVFPSCVC